MPPALLSTVNGHLMSVFLLTLPSRNIVALLSNKLMHNASVLTFLSAMNLATAHGWTPSRHTAPPYSFPAVRTTDGLPGGFSQNGGELEEGRFHIPQPRTCIPHLLTTPPGVDLILLPAISVGRDGSRMGKGAGYYDHALADIHTAVAAGNLAAAPVLAAIVYSSELVDIVPTESHDVRMDWVVTPTELHNCAQPSA